jgi:hypothetical protein
MLREFKMKVKQIVVLVACFFPVFSVYSNPDEFVTICQEDADSTGLTGKDLSDYVAECIAMYSTEESDYEEGEESEGYTEEQSENVNAEEE